VYDSHVIIIITRPNNIYAVGGRGVHGEDLQCRLLVCMSVHTKRLKIKIFRPNLACDYHLSTAQSPFILKVKDQMSRSQGHKVGVGQHLYRVLSSFVV